MKQWNHRLLWNEWNPKMCHFQLYVFCLLSSYFFKWKRTKKKKKVCIELQMMWHQHFKSIDDKDDVDFNLVSKKKDELNLHEDEKKLFQANKNNKEKKKLKNDWKLSKTMSFLPFKLRWLFVVSINFVFNNARLL